MRNRASSAKGSQPARQRLRAGGAGALVRRAHQAAKWINTLPVRACANSDAISSAESDEEYGFFVGVGVWANEMGGRVKW